MRCGKLIDRRRELNLTGAKGGNSSREELTEVIPKRIIYRDRLKRTLYKGGEKDNGRF